MVIVFFASGVILTLVMSAEPLNFTVTYAVEVVISEKIISGRSSRNPYAGKPVVNIAMFFFRQI